jgi:D-glycero-beta-D-manno-heptose 1-phosphate adenylyltransferase
VLVVGIEDDVRVKAFKGAYRPVNTISQRVELMEALEFVDYTFVIKGSPKQDIKSFYTRLHRTLQADVLAVSEGDPNLKDRQEEIEAAGGYLLVVSRMEEGSSTSLIRRVLAETEFSDLVYVSKKSLKNHITENQNSWYQLALPMTP